MAAIAGMATLVAAMPAAAQARKVISISGSTSVFPLETLLAKKWIKTKQGKKYSFRILQGGSNVGVSDVAAGRVTMGASSRDPDPGSDPGGLVFTRISRDAICLITNDANPLGNISQATIQGLFLPTITKPFASSQITDWSKVPGSPITGTVDAIGRATTSGTHDAFSKILLGGQTQGSFVQPLASNGLVQQGVKNDPHGIGYVSLAFTSGVHVVPYNGVNCDLRDAQAGTYGAVRSFYFVTQGAPVGGAKSFINWILHNGKANKIIKSDWVPLH